MYLPFSLTIIKNPGDGSCFMNPVSLQLEQWSGILGTGKDLADERKETKLQSKRSVICDVVTQSKNKT